MIAASYLTALLMPSRNRAKLDWRAGICLASLLYIINTSLLAGCSSPPPLAANRSTDVENENLSESTETASADSSLRDLLDNRRGASGSDESGFLPFMRPFHSFAKAQNWQRMKELVRPVDTHSEYFNRLIGLATMASMPGMRSVDAPWNPREELNAAGYTTLAMCLLAAIQDENDPRNATLTEEQLFAIRIVWQYNYSTALILVGSPEDPPPSDIQESVDKNLAAQSIADLLQDPELQVLSILAAAWLLERIGETGKSESIRETLDPVIESVDWPPIRKTGTSYLVALPEWMPSPEEAMDRIDPNR